MKLSKALLVRMHKQTLAKAAAISCIALAKCAHCVMYLQAVIQLQLQHAFNPRSMVLLLISLKVCKAAAAKEFML